MSRVVMVVAVVAACGNSSAPESTKVKPAPPPAVDAAAPVDAAPPVDAIAPAADEPPDDPTGPDIMGITFKLEVRPGGTLTLKQAKHALFRITVTNGSKNVYSPVHTGFEFTVDGESSMQLDMSFGNGGYAGTWGELPPGKTAFDERGGVEDLGVGKHAIVMSSWGRDIAKTVVTLVK